MAHTTDRIDTADAVQEPSFQRISANRQWLQSVGWRIDSEFRRHENLVVAIAIAVVTLFSLLFAWRKPFDVDEYLVRITDLAGSPSAIWRILKTAPLSVDPPLYHFLVHYFLRIFGPTEFVQRLPSVLAYASMTFFLYRVVCRYSDIYTGLIVLTLSLQCGVFAFAYYARPYALLLAADAMALLCWVIAIEEQGPRNIALLGIFFGIAIAVGSHWFGFLVLIPLILGEVVRTWQKHKLDLPVCIAITGGAATAMAYLPLLRAAVAYRGMPWKGVAINDIAATYQLILEPCLVPLLLLVVMALARAMLTAPRPDACGSELPIPVFVCVAAFALSPFAGFILAKIVTHAFQPRYTLLCSIGVLLLVALAVREGMAARVPWMAFSALILTGLISFVQFHSFLELPSGGDTAALADVSFFSANGSLPVVPGSDWLFLRMEAHAPASLRQRCVFPTDHDFIRFTHNNTNFLMTEGFRRWTKLPVVDLSTFLSAHPQFYFIRITEQDWLMQRMVEDHAQIMLQGTYDGHPVYLVSVRP